MDEAITFGKGDIAGEMVGLDLDKHGTAELRVSRQSLYDLSGALGLLVCCSHPHFAYHGGYPMVL